MSTSDIKKFLTDKFAGKKVCILGFGREGKSTFRVLNRFLDSIKIVIADSNPTCKDEFIREFNNNEDVSVICGNHYLEALSDCDILVKSPGISFQSIKGKSPLPPITSQTELFLELFRDQVIGVTGTKGKSTTVSLLYNMLINAEKDVVLGGNIGTPPLEFIEKVNDNTIVVFEMSSHQLENIRVSPSVAVLLNIFQEHLDHYESYRHYQLAKFNIALWQKPGDVFIFNGKSDTIRELLKEHEAASLKTVIHCNKNDEAGIRCMDDDLIINDGTGEVCIEKFCSQKKLPGEHNLTNIMAAAMAAYLKGVGPEVIRSTVASFDGLPHRLEFVGRRNGALYYNDSISTIPESTIEALKTFPGVHTLLLGGYDRGVDYSKLVAYLLDNPCKEILFIGKAGARIANELESVKPDILQQYMLFHDFESAVHTAFRLTPSGKICLLSPAAASYDMFRNFEHRGEKFRQMILQSNASA
ncbi:MAG: UDP-N-acetylmuramoyl-L-alanine--D-glutamate ligase [Bacteroidales bacterium]